MHKMRKYDEWKERILELKEIYGEVLCQKFIRTMDEKATEKEILEYEEKLRTPLPKSLREFFLNFTKNLTVSVGDGYNPLIKISIDNLYRCLTTADDPDYLYGDSLANVLPFIDVPNGDVLAFDLSDSNEDKKVVYISHGDADYFGVLISRNFDEYMTNLLDIGMLQTEIWEMKGFLTEGYGLDANCAEAKEFKENIKDEIEY